MQFELVAVELDRSACGRRLDAAAGRRSRRRGCRGVIGSVPAAIVRRLATWVRSGPTRPPAGVPRTVWHIDAGPLTGRRLRPRLPLGVVGRSAPAAICASRQRSKSAAASATTSDAHMRVLQAAELGALAAIDARPVGDEIGCRSRGPGSGPCLPVRLGTQKEWITSVDVELDRTGSPDRDVDLVRGGEAAARRRRPRSGPPTTIGAR